MKRTSFGEASMRYLPLADIFTAATVSILLMIVISSRSATNSRETVQADRVYVCATAREAGKPIESDATYKRIAPPPSSAALSAEALKKELLGLPRGGALSLRIQLVALVEDRVCIRRFHKLVEDHNDSFNSGVTNKAPNAYLLADIVRLPQADLPN